MDYVKLQSTFSGTEVDLADFEGVEIVGGTTGIRAYVGLVTDIEGTDPKTLYNKQQTGKPTTRKTIS